MDTNYFIIYLCELVLVPGPGVLVTCFLFFLISCFTFLSTPCSYLFPPPPPHSHCCEARSGFVTLAEPVVVIKISASNPQSFPGHLEYCFVYDLPVHQEWSFSTLGGSPCTYSVMLSLSALIFRFQYESSSFLQPFSPYYSSARILCGKFPPHFHSPLFLFV